MWSQTLLDFVAEGVPAAVLEVDSAFAVAQSAAPAKVGLMALSVIPILVAVSCLGIVQRVGPLDST